MKEYIGIAYIINIKEKTERQNGKVLVYRWEKAIATENTSEYSYSTYSYYYYYYYVCVLYTTA